MKNSTLKSFLDVHSWTGLGAGLALFIAFYTGAITVFMHELEAWDSYTDQAQALEPPAQAQQLLDQVLQTPYAAQMEVLRLDLASPEHPRHQARWFERQDDGDFKRHEFRLAPGGELDTALDTSHLPGFIYRLHYTAGLPDSFGLYVLGFVCIIYGIALVSGVILFLPNALKDLFVVRPGRNKKRFWLDAHNVVGVLSLPWHIMYAWSSAVIGIGLLLLAPFQWLVFDDDLMATVGPQLGFMEQRQASGEAAAPLPVAQLLAIAQTQAPGMTPTQLRYNHPGDASSTVMVRGKANADTLASGVNVTLDATSGTVLGVNHPASASGGATFYKGLLALHYVEFGGYPAKWVYFVLGLAGAFLFYSGNLLWVESRRRRRSAEQSPATVFMARLNSGVCIGCMAGVSAAFLASRASAGLDNRPELTELAYFAVFFAAIGWCLLRPVAAGARDLLYLCALLTAAIPVLDAIDINMPLWRAAGQGYWDLFFVQLLAIGGALAFWRMGRAVHLRSRHGVGNSVWSEPPAPAAEHPPRDNAPLNLPD
ncbi:PepSY-associated TM helix domain-containing protein [Parahaliea mediterranea]|uniref:PepSY-associated TM helix domain-containing protein n=1 Tax=Parahaliea mediterranea TaxID=651086 RepID=UPI000E2EEB5A|nr:PepSY-associated TM helix domain-containing protein [Parahaliea mediterranea]